MKAAQVALHEALQYYVFGSLNSDDILKSFVLKRFLRPTQLNKALESLKKLPEIASSVAIQKPGRLVSNRDYAARLAEAFVIWRDIVPEADAPSSIVPLAKPYETWLAAGGFNDRYWPVHALHDLIEIRGASLFLRGIMHGSVATLDDLEGFSDLDLAFIVRSSVLTDRDGLMGLRCIAGEILLLTYAFDPFMHHGPYYICEIDLKWYPEAMFPLILFDYGVDLFPQNKDLLVIRRENEEVTDNFLDVFHAFFSNWRKKDPVVQNSYELEWVLGSAMLLPALYLQRKTGEFRFKRHTFSIAKNDFDAEHWGPIEIASRIRRELGRREKPSRSLLRMGRILGWPGLLQRTARQSSSSILRARSAAQVMGPDYPETVVRLIESMRSKCL